MEDKARQAKNEYMRQWYAKNKDKAKAAQERYWNKKAENIEGGTNCHEKGKSRY